MPAKYIKYKSNYLFDEEGLSFLTWVLFYSERS